MDDNALGFISTFGYSPDGFRVTVSLNLLVGEVVEATFAELGKLIVIGNLTVNPPGVEVGEESEVVTHIVRRAKPSDNTPIIGFYLDHPDMVHKWFQVYLNFDDAGKAFAKQLTDAAGLDSIKSQPLWTGDGFPDKTTMTGIRAQYFIRLPYPIRVVRKDTGEEGDFNGRKYPIYELVRIERADNSTADTTPEDSATWNVSDLIRVIKDWSHFDGQSVHAANAIRKLAVDGELKQGMTHEEALNVFVHHYDLSDDEQDEYPLAEYKDDAAPLSDDIPF